METQTSTRPDPLLQSSKLLQQPPEIRDAIWILAAKLENEGTSRQHGAYDPTTSHHLLHPLRATCRTANCEASPHIFNLTVFSIDDRDISHKRFFIWLERIGTSNRLAIHRFCPAVFSVPPDRIVDLIRVSRHDEAAKWARVLKALPNLRHLSFSPNGTCHGIYWSSLFQTICRDPAPELKIHELFTAVQSCHHLSSWTYKHGTTSMIVFATKVAGLQALQINVKNHISLAFPPTVSITTCPAMRYLQLGRFPANIWRDFVSSSERSISAPPESLRPRFLYDVVEPDFDCRGRHTFSVHIVLIPDLRIEPKPFRGDISADMRPLLRACPNLTYLALECQHNYLQIDSFPSSLETVALVFETGLNMKELGQRLLALRFRCRSLIILAIYINWQEQHDHHRWDRMLALSEPVLQVLQILQEQGVHVAYYIRKSEGSFSKLLKDSWSGDGSSKALLEA